MSTKKIRPIDNPDFGKAASDYGNYRAGFPASLYERLSEWDIGTGDMHIVDLGTGTGSLARGFAQRGNQVVGIDPAEEMIAMAREIDIRFGVTVDYRVATAEHTTLPDNCADVVTAGQCWHWFDRQAAISEVCRLLRPAGRLLIVHYDWIPLSGNIVRETEKLIEAHNPDWSGGNWNGVYGQWLGDMGEAGLDDIESFSYDEAASYTHESWRGRVRASAGISANLDTKSVRVFDQALEQMLADKFPDKDLLIPHRVFAVKARFGDL